MSNLFDPTKLNLDFDDLDNDLNEKNPKKTEEKEEENTWFKPEELLKEELKKEIQEEIPEAETQEKIDILDSFEVPKIPKKEVKKEEDYFKEQIELEKQKIKETPKEEENPKEIEPEKKDLSDVYNITEENPSPKNQKVIDQAISGLSDLIDICYKNKYEYFTCVPDNTLVTIEFKVWEEIKETRYIHFNVYSKIIVKAKVSWNLDVENDKTEQKWEWKIDNKWIKFKTVFKFVPSEFGEKLYFKLKEDLKIKSWNKTKSSVSWTQILTFLLSILVIVLLLLWVFISFVVLNAKTPQDVELFKQLWINVWEINRFIKTIVSVVFTILCFIESIFFSIFVFRSLLTKKIYKRKKTVSTVLATFMLLLLLWTSSLGLALYKKELPNWASLARGNIQLFDNTKYISPDFSEDQSLIWDYNNVIWPITIRYDLTNFVSEKRSEWFVVSEFIWDFGDWKEVITPNPVIIKEFTEKWLYKISLNVSWSDKWNPNTLPVDWIESINIVSTVKYTENVLPNGWKIVEFDASSLENYWSIKWYMDWTDSTPEMYVFKPGQAFFNDTYVWMKIIVNWKEKGTFDKVFLISSSDSDSIKWDISSKKSLNDDLTFTFKAENTSIKEWNWFIEKYEWIFGDDIVTIDDVDLSSLESIEESSEIDYTFKEYWDKTVILKIYDSLWNYKTITKEIKIPKMLALKTTYDFYIDWVKYDFNPVTPNMANIEAPSNLKFDARRVRAENLLYSLQEVYWDFDWDWNYDKKWKEISYEILKSGIYDVWIEYEFVHRKDTEDVVKIKKSLNLDVTDREVTLDFEIKPESLFAPTIVSFDASKSKIKWQNIVKFIYDYWDGLEPEERSAINKWHKYIKEWTYTVKLTAVTESWEQFSTEKNFVLNKQSERVSISSTIKRAPILQEIDFSSWNSVWEIETYLWDFGDGQKSREANPTHFYEEPWKYTVKLTVDFTSKNRLEDTYEVEITN